MMTRKRLEEMIRELFAHAEATIPTDTEAPAEKSTPQLGRIPQIGEVWRDPARRHGYGGGKFEATEYAIAHNDYSKWEFVCDQPHGDGDFSYLCNDSECRCHQ